MHRTKTMIIIISLLTIPLYASLDCIDNSEHLQYGSFDTKKIHSVECNCPCTAIKGGKCVECGHLQNARPWTVVQKSSFVQSKHTSIQGPPTMKEIRNYLVQQYIKQ